MEAFMLFPQSEGGSNGLPSEWFIWRGGALVKTCGNTLVRRYFVLCLGLIIMSFGVAFSIKAGLGTSPISSLPYTISQISPITVGTATIFMHCGMIVLQILLLRRRYDPLQLMQLPVALLFGALTDFSVWALQGVTYTSYVTQWLLCAVGILLVGAGVSLEGTANAVTLAGEGAVLAICKVLPLKFTNVKTGFDVSLVVISCLLSLLFLGYLAGVREGTVAAALLVGLTAKQFNKPLGRFAAKYLT